MFIQNVLILQAIIHVSSSETPIAICSIDKPFEKSDNTCGNFNDICVKNDDLQCNNFQAACKQCPPTNYTVYRLLHLESLIIKKMAAFKDQIDDSRKKIDSLTGVIIFLVVFFIAYIIIMLVSTPKGKHKSIGHCLFTPKKSKRSNINEKERFLINKQMEKLNILEEKIETIINKSKSSLKEMESMKNEKGYHIDEKQSLLINEQMKNLPVYHKLRFQLPNQFDETELFVSNFDSVIKLKKSICDRNMNTNDYKRMIMKYKGVTLDNNQYLLSCIDSTNIPIFCEFDNNVDVNAMIVIKLKCDNIYPEMLQIWKYQQIKDIKNIISELNKTYHEDLLIVYKSTQLDDDKTIDYYKIEDNDWIQIVNKSEEMKNITMKSIFTDKETISIEFSKFETVSDIIDRSIQKIQPKITTNYYFVVFLNKKVMQNDKFIYEYNIDSKSLVEFCYFKNVNEINELVIPDDYGHIKMGEAKNKITKRPVLIKAYKREYMDIENDNDLSRVLREDLQIFQLTKFHPRFIQLFDIYLDNDFFYIELEDLRKGLMKKFLSKKKKKGNEISIYDISKWAYQILEGLKFLHNHNIILKDMNPMNIWIDENFDIKLTSFNTTEYLNHLNDENKNKYIYGVDQYKPIILAYVAPEILESEPYDASVDVWSLGVIMIDIITVEVLYFGHSNSQVVDIIKESRTIEYDKTNKPKYLTDFIDCCVKGDPTERAKINDLMKMEFIKKYLL